MSGSPVDDLLDLDQESWRTDLTDPDWIPEKTSDRPKRSHKPTVHKPASKPTKRRSTSTTEDEIQIEIEQSTKRAKV